MKVIAVYNVKGGVGKTSTAVNLGYLSARDGARTLLWDLDPQGSATYVFRVKPKVRGGGRALVERNRPLAAAIKATDYENLDIVPADFRYRNMDLDLDDSGRRTRRLGQVLQTVRKEYDVVYLDCPPSASLVSENVLRAASLLVVPLVPSPLSVATFERLVEFVEDAKGKTPHVLAFFSMADRRRAMHRDVMARMRESSYDVADSVIPVLSVIERLSDRRAPVPAFAPRSAATRAYEQLAAEVAAQ